MGDRDQRAGDRPCLNLGNSSTDPAGQCWRHPALTRIEMTAGSDDWRSISELERRGSNKNEGTRVTSQRLNLKMRTGCSLRLFRCCTVAADTITDGTWCRFIFRIDYIRNNSNFMRILFEPTKTVMEINPLRGDLCTITDRFW